MSPMSQPGPEMGVGYQSAVYAVALGMARRVQALPACGGHLLLRAIAGSDQHDACGAYPVFSCRTPARLGDDIEALGQSLVSVTLVADPLLDWDRALLERSFEVVRPLGAHYVIDIGKPDFRPSPHHGRALRRAAVHDIEFRIDACPVGFAPAWSRLYELLVEHAGISGLRRFSEAIFGRMLAVPGTVVVTAWERDELLGADWYFEDGERAYAHLSAYSKAGYARAASYPMMDAALRHFAGRGARLMDLGGVPVVGGGGEGLARFKEGWSTRTLPSWLCGRRLNPTLYDQLCLQTGTQAVDYFPAYRLGEYG